MLPPGKANALEIQDPINLRPGFEAFMKMEDPVGDVGLIVETVLYPGIVEFVLFK